jgi:hypothetical protein
VTRSGHRSQAGPFGTYFLERGSAGFLPKTTGGIIWHLREAVAPDGLNRLDYFGAVRAGFWPEVLEEVLAR